MADIVNLRTARKDRDRVRKRAEGNENAARFGRSKALAALERDRTEKSHADHEAHRKEEPEV